MLLPLILIVALAISCAPEKKVRKRFTPKPCIECHEEKLKDLELNFVHAPAAKKDCEACHLRHGRLAIKSFIENSERKLCYKCHTDMAEQMSNIGNTHTVLKQGLCIPCHNPHASQNKYLQKSTGKALCYTCHERTAFERTKRHQPVEEGCGSCHAPHGSDYPDNLIKNEIALCNSCHDYKATAFTEAHRNYPVENAKCTGCHSPHSSTNDQLLRESVHEPVQKAACSSCHNPVDSSDPLAVSESGDKLCYSCHEAEKDKYNKSNMHTLTKEGKCITCHSPHASDFSGITLMDNIKLCTQCHKDSPSLDVSQVHKPVTDEGCTVCHNPMHRKWPVY